MRFKIKGIRIEISFWFVAVTALMMIVFPESKGFFCFLFCILHEIGHLLSMLIFDKKPSEIKLDYFGMKIVTCGKYMSVKKEIITALAGPLVNIIIFVILMSLKQKDIAYVSLALAVFNLLPVQILDGGRILSMLIRPSFQIKKIGIPISVILLIIGIAVAIHSKNNFSIIFAAIYLLTANFSE